MVYDIAGMMDGIRNTYKQSRVGTLAKLAYSQPERRQGALSEMYGIDPNSANTMRKEFDEQDKAQLAEFSRAFINAPPTMKGQMYERGKAIFGPKIQALGGNVPDKWEDAEPFLREFAGVQASGIPSDVQSFNYFTQGMTPQQVAEARQIKLGLAPKVGTEGIKYLPNGGVAYEDPVSRKVFIRNPGDTQWNEFEMPGQTKPSGGITNGEAAPVTLEEVEKVGEVMRRQNVPVEQINAWKAQQIAAIDAANGMGNFRQAAGAVPPPAAGGRPLPNLNPKDPPKTVRRLTPQEIAANGLPTGTVAQIDESTGAISIINKPEAPAGSGKLTDDMRKTSTLLSRMDFALQQIQQVEGADPKANRPGYGIVAADLLPEAVGNSLKSGTRQQIEAAQLDALDAALTLATGAAYTREQLLGLRKSYFPQPNDTEDTIKAKQARFKNVIESARVRAGNAAQQPAASAGGKQFDPLGILK